MHPPFDRGQVLAELQAIVGPLGMVSGGDSAAYVQGARYGAGDALAIVRPATTDEVSRVVRVCVAHRVRVVPQGANTGLVGASTPDTSGHQVVLSLGRMRQACDIDAANRSVTLAAGVTLQELNERLEAFGLWFPVDLSANPTIGGMVAANTGGTRLIRYGDVRHNLLAIEAVLFHPPGEIVRLGSALRKDNTGHDLKQLFVGTSGAAGIITAATLEVHPRPRQSATALVVPASDDAVPELLTALEHELGDFLCAFEGMSASAMQAAIDHVPMLRNPFAPEPLPDMAILVELESCVSPAATGLDLQDLLTRFLQDRFETLVANAVIGNGPELWHLRHGISEGSRGIGKTIAFDVSVPRARILAFRTAANAYVRAAFPHLRVVDFGHIADGGIHFNVVWPHGATPAYNTADVQRLRDDLYALVVQDFGGSFSAEHGVGPHNLACYRRYTSPVVQAMAGGIQHLLDPLRLCGTVDFGPAVPSST